MSDTRPCPACPDGNVWSLDGPTGKTCPVCNGAAEINLDGSPTIPPRKPQNLGGIFGANRRERDE